MAGELIFITGGARSGKSAFAEGLVRAHGGAVAFVATAAAGDAEMALRIEKHRSRRPADWTTFECGESLAEAITQAAADHDVVLVDCLTVYLARLLPHLPDEGTAAAEVSDALDLRLDQELAELIAAVGTCDRPVLVVSNELGCGLVPTYPSGRLFRDLVGRANQFMAAAAGFAYVVVAGVPLDLKRLHASEFPWRVDQ